MKEYLKNSTFISAAFLMATSAIGPGFLTQTTNFTQQLMASCGAIILISIIIDVFTQLNVWRILTIKGQKASELSNELLPGAGNILTVLILFGGLAFNIGNLAGAGLGINVLFGISVSNGAILSALIAIFIFLLKSAGEVMDLFVKILGLVMLGFTLFIAFQTNPPLGEVALKAIAPDKLSWTAIVTLVGGTVGGYITFAGAHRLLDVGIIGEAKQSDVSKSAVTAILLASAMRILLFLAALGVLLKGAKLNEANPAASVYEFAAGQIGYKIFGLVIWAASITSVVGSAYTSISFFKTLHQKLQNSQIIATVVFILISTIVFVIWGKPIFILIWAGTINGFILPFSLGLMLLAVRKKRIFGTYQHPLWLTISGWFVVGIMLYMSVSTLIEQVT